MKVYISGPITGITNGNRAAFRKAQAHLVRTGNEVVNPHELDDPGAEPMSWSDCMRRDLAALVTCDAILMLPGWPNSRGANLEHHVARELGLLVLDDPEINP